MKELWEKAVQNDRASEEQLLSYLRERFTVIARLSMGKEDADDIAQEACLAVLKDYRNLESPYEYNAWAVRIVKNKIASHLRKNSLTKRVFSGGEFVESAHSGSDNVQDHELLLTLTDCLRQMQDTHPRYYEILRLVQQGFSAVDICARMGVSRNNLYVILNRARGHLRDCIFSGDQST